MQKIVISCAAVVVLALFGVSIAAINDGNNAAPAIVSTTQPDTRPVQLIVLSSGNGVSSTDAAAALQSQSAQSATLGASTGTQSSLLGQPGSGLQQAGGGSINDRLR